MTESSGVAPVQFQDLERTYRDLSDELDAAYQAFMDSGHYVLGPQLDLFEEEYAAYCEAAHCVGVGNGLDALRLALRACEIGVGDEVVVPSNTYIATWLAVSEVGATIVPVEPNPVTFNLDPDRARAVIGPRTKALLPVNLYGLPCAYDQLGELARAHGLRLIVDNAQAHGARFRGRPVGAIGDLECHSFYPTKNLGAYGDGGAVTTDDSSLADRVRLLRNYGSRVRYENEVLGVNSRLDELQAAFLRVRLRHLDEANGRRREIAQRYAAGLDDLQALTLPAPRPGFDHVWHLYVVRHPDRDTFRERLARLGVQTLVHYPIPPHLSEAYRPLGFTSGHYPVAERIAREVVSLPLHPALTDAEVERVIQSTRNAAQ